MSAGRGEDVPAENACHYLNHGLTKVPWTLRNKGYGFPLSRNTDLRPSECSCPRADCSAPTNGQFVSSILGPGDFAILESPRFNITQGINVLLFQYYRPTHASTIRLCLGTRYTKPLRTISSFMQCPPILRSLTSKNAFKWNSVHIQLPSGTTHVRPANPARNRAFSSTWSRTTPTGRRKRRPSPSTTSGSPSATHGVSTQGWRRRSRRPPKTHHSISRNRTQQAGECYLLLQKLVPME